MNGWEKSASLTFRGTIYLSSHAQVKEYAHVIEDQESQTLELSHMLEARNPGVTLSQYDNPAFNLLRLELEGVQELAAQLKANGGVSGASDLLYQLQNWVCRYIKEPSLTLTAPVLPGEVYLTPSKTLSFWRKMIA